MSEIRFGKVTLVARKPEGNAGDVTVYVHTRTDIGHFHMNLFDAPQPDGSKLVSGDFISIRVAGNAVVGLQIIHQPDGSLFQSDDQL